MSGADLVNSFLEDPSSFFHKLKQDPLSEIESLKNVSNWLELSSHPTFELCVRVLLDDFLNNFRNGINDLTHNFPKDARNVERETGVDLGPFWHGHKRFPQSASFDPDDPTHIDYIYHGANILASVFGLQEQDRETVRKIAMTLPIPAWEYTGAVVDLSGQEGEEKKDGGQQQQSPPKQVTEEEHETIQRLTSHLSSLQLSSFSRLHPADFEKDNDRNHHIDFITASTNLRAWNYHMKAATRNKVRLVAGKIIPAIATTTACITGFIGIEIYKYVKQVPLSSYRACTINLATNVYCCENLPDPVKKKTGMDPATYMSVVAIPEGHTVWDMVVINKPKATLQQLLDAVKEQHHGVSIEMLATPSGTVFYNGIDLWGDQKEKVLQRLQTDVVELYETLVGPIFPKNRNYILFDCSVETESGDSGIMPLIKYVFRQDQPRHTNLS